MAGPTLIQIKRSLDTSIPASLANGEFGYTANGDVLYIGSNATIVAIGGKRFPGVVTANQAIVTNATNMVDTIRFGNTTVNAVVNSISLTLANSTVTWTLPKPTAAQVSDTNYFIASDGTWKQTPAGATSLDGLSDVTIASAANNELLIYDNAAGVWENHAAGNGFTFTTHTLHVLAAATSGIVSNTTGIWARAANGISVDSAGINVLAGTNGGLLSNTTGTWVRAANGISLTSAGVNVLGGSTLTVNTTGVHVNATLSITDLTLSGNLVVSGTMTTVDTTNLRVTDSLIKLADEQADSASLADALDIGVFGESGNTTQVSYHGLFRDASDGRWKLFTGQIPDPTTTVDTANVNFAFANLQVNAIFLSTALVGTMGGTGRSSATSQDILVANTTNGYNLLSIGTDGKVLQAVGGALAYADLDGGTF